MQVVVYKIILIQEEWDEKKNLFAGSVDMLCY